MLSQRLRNMPKILTSNQKKPKAKVKMDHNRKKKDALN